MMVFIKHEANKKAGETDAQAEEFNMGKVGFVQKKLTEDYGGVYRKKNTLSNRR